MVKSSLRLLAAAGLLAAAQGMAQAPDASGPVRLIVAGAPGSPPDTLARIVGDGQAGGVRFVVENRPGGLGTIAMSALAKAPADGRTLGITSVSQAAAPNLLAQMPYDLARDFSPVTQLAWTATVLVVRPSSSLKDVADLVALAKARPGVLVYASAGTATPSHLAAELFRHRAGIEARHAPYKGIPAGLAALVGGQVDFAFAGAAASLPLLRSGKLRALGTAGERRLPALPEVPTIAELGFAGYRLNEWFGVVAPAATPPEIVARHAVALARSLALEETRQRLAQLGLYPPDQLGPEAFGALIRAELPRWRQITREAGIRAE
jgi:tripartite-type tricarboxylate transporter receptor subunit TctC